MKNEKWFPSKCPRFLKRKQKQIYEMFLIASKQKQILSFRCHIGFFVWIFFFLIDSQGQGYFQWKFDQKLNLKISNKFDWLFIYE